MPRIPRKEVRARHWKLPSVRAERRTQRREFNREAREAGEAFTEAFKAGRRGEAELLLLDVREANRRALEVRGVPVGLASKHGLLTEDWNSRALQSVLRKLDNLMAKGFTVKQSLDQLEQRAFKVYDTFREERRSDLLVLAREFYTRQQRQDRLRRKRQRPAA